MNQVSPRSPILVTGAHRSGTTWLAEMLALTSGTQVVAEPFNISPRAYALDGLAKHWFTYAPALPQYAAQEAFGKVLESKTAKVFPRRSIRHWVPPLRRGRLVIKDPIACLSSEWLASNFELNVIVIVRHPAAFAASLKRMSWEFPFEHFLEQSSLMEEHLSPYRAQIESRPSDLMVQAALLWKCLYETVFTYLGRNPGWILRTHEQLSRDPVTELKKLYELLDLTWSDDVEEHVKAYTKAGNPIAAPENVPHQMKRDSAANVNLWKETLTAREIAVVYEHTRDIFDVYYPGQDWE